MGNSDYDNFRVRNAVNNPKWKTSKQEIAMTSIAHGKAFWIGSNLRDGTVEFGIEVVCSLDATLGVPFKDSVKSTSAAEHMMTLVIQPSLATSTLANLCPR